MRRRIKIVLWTPILLFFVGSGLIFLIFSTPLWKHPVIQIVNNRLLNKFELSLKVRKIEGNVFSNLELVDAELRTIRKNKILKARHVKVSYILNSFLSPNPELLGIEIDGGEFSFPNSIDTLQYLLSKHKKIKKTDPGAAARVKEPTQWKFDFGVTNFTYRHNNEPYLIEMLFGEFSTVEDQLDISLDTAHFYIKDDIDLFTLSKAKLHNDFQGFSVSHIALKNYNANLVAALNFPKDSTGVVRIIANNVQPVHYLPAFKEEFSEGDSLNLSCLVTITDSIKVFADFYGQLRCNTIEKGNITASVFNNNLTITDFSLSSLNESVRLDFHSVNERQHHGNFAISNLDLSKWNVADLATKFTGKSHFNIDGKLNNPKAIRAEIDITDTAIDTLKINHVNGKITYQNHVLQIDRKIEAQLAENHFSLTGNTNLKTKVLNLDCQVDAPDIGIFSPLLHRDGLTGGIFGKLQIRGRMNDPDLYGELSATEIGLPELYFDETKLKFGALNLLTDHHGSIVLNANDGSTKFIKIPFPSLNLDVTFHRDTTNVRQLTVKGPDFDLDLSARIIGFRNFTINRIDGNLRNNKFSNLTPLKIRMDENDITIDQSYLVINESKLEFQGFVKNNQLANARVILKEFDLSSINDFLPQKHHLAGKTSGQFFYNTRQDSQVIDLKIEGQDLVYRKDHFKQMVCRLSLMNDRIIIPEISLTDSANGFVNARGYFSCNFPLKKGQTFIDTTSMIDMEMDFNNFNLSILNTYVLYNTKLGGRLLGDVSFKNTLNQPDIATSFYILDPVIDKVKTNSLRVAAKVEKSTVEITDLFLTDDAGSYYAKGTLPVEIALLDGIFNITEDGEMKIDVFSEINAIPALPEYIEAIQSVKGDMVFNLKLSGPPLKPVATGKFEMNDGELKVSDLENSIYGLNGVGIIENNILTIENFSGQMKNTDYIKWRNTFAQILKNIFTKSIINPNAPNVTLKGQIDLNDPARPDINLNLDGKDIYIRTLLGEQEGIADARIKIFGQDTLTIDGDLLMKNFTVRNELVAMGETYEEKSSSGIYTNINFHLISPGNFYIKNSVMECELSGEGWLFKEGDDDFRISGDFSILDGILSYQGIWEFTDLQGNILFIPTEINPTLDLQAKLDLSGMHGQSQDQSGQTMARDDDSEAEITVYLTGDLEKPDLQFESEVYSQSDILRILTFTYDDTDRDLRNMTSDIASSFLQRQLNRQVSKYTGLDEFQLKTQGNFLEGEFDSQISLMMGRRITNNLYITYERGFDEDKTDPRNFFGLRYRIDQKKSISGRIDNNGLFELQYKFRHHY
ncbi:MAG: translocation/assembly module TamB domain-containing protein [Candidatus Marinimicrobia bacterium]|nr:translocation/assembly module TamB domain-containing protein [Candidatus Neomarinimicrobiota bacterium]